MDAMPPIRRNTARNLGELQRRFVDALRTDRPAQADAAVEQALAIGLDAQDVLIRVGLAATEALRDDEVRDGPAVAHYRNARMVERALARLEPAIPAAVQAAAPVVVLGNAEQDFHDLGRRIVGLCLRGAGYRVIDLGLSVPNEALLRAAEEHGARVIGVSSLLLQTAKQIPRLKELLVQRGRDNIRLIVGGAPFRVDPELHEKFGADGVARDPLEAIRLVDSIYADRARGAKQ
jgi:methylmalonyl-CoA mutase cobalamin-binding domain/chain